ncbi:MAG: class I mannose-6-phosphate isomerase [Clostridia bacterium]|nr:class I mannose-6-phosphate isomerase [Clostridia bacterium]
MYPLLLKTHDLSGEQVTPVMKNERENPSTVYMLKAGGRSENVIKNGGLADTGLKSIASRLFEGREMPPQKFPVEIKLINTAERLPVTVYPDDEYANAHGEPCGKIALIYVADCKKGAEMVYGLSRNVTPDELKARVQGGSLAAVCNFVTVQKGDIFFIPPGVVFAIGGGITALMISNNSKSEYIISDYGRVDEKGKPRPLQIDRALEVMKTRKNNLRYGDTGEMTLYPFGTVRELGVCDAFKVELITMDGSLGVYDDAAPVSLILTSGELDMSYPTGTMHLKAGNSVLIPPGIKVKLAGKAEVIHTRV